MNEDTIVGKAYDSKLMKRLLKYAVPYWRYLLVSILLLITITGLELLSPYLIKIAIDDHINGYQMPMIVVEANSNLEGIELDGNKYVKKSTLSDSELEQYSNYQEVNILKDESDYYIVDYKAKDINGGIKLNNDLYMKFRESDIEGLDKVTILFFFVIIFTFVFNYGQVYILNYTSQKIIFTIRQEIFNHLLSLSIGYFDKNPIGRLVTRVTNDTETLNEMYTDVLITLIKDLFMLVGITIVMLSMDYKLALISFALLPFILLISVYFRKHIRNIYRISRAQLAKINSSLNENITGMKIINIFKKEEKVSNEFDKINSDYLGTQQKEIKLFAIYRPSLEIIRSIGIASIVYFGGGKVLNGAIEFGVLYAFINYLQKFFEPILDLTEKYNLLQNAMASSERIFTILDDNSRIENIDKTTELGEVKGKIEFRNVWFAYIGEDWVLKDISFIINPGQSIAFVGATGAGKSSIINLITRFYDIQKGEILIDGINIKDVDKAELRKNIGVVLQDVFLFAGTIEDNIKLNNEDINDVVMDEIVKYVNAEHFISKLPHKYKEPVMERGSTLSAGERQLLAFARTLVYNPRILILDEATANIDTETELLIQDALTKLTKDRTSIAVAHRLSTIQHADQIIVLSHGVIKEMGNHQELLDKQGLYYDLYRLQYK